jgi:hypothetical protein
MNHDMIDFETATKGDHEKFIDHFPQNGDLLRRPVNSAHTGLRGPFSLREKDRMRAGFAVVCPHPDPLPEGGGEKLYALFVGRISNSTSVKGAPLT